MKNFATYIFALFLLLLTGSCKDDLLYRDIEIGDGESFIDATVNFYPNVESLSTKSTPGNTIENINNLSIIIYDQYKSLHKVYNSINGDFQFTSSTHDKQPSMSDEDYNNGGQWSSQPQASASFKLPEKLPYGKYYIYCVANMGEIDEDDVDSIEKLQNISVEWNSNNIAENNQMFGYFTSESESDSDKPIAGFDADAVYITKNVQPIHAWIKRVASKITVAYDGSGLYQDVYIYIRKVTVKDIPSTCLLGADNKPVPSSDGISPLIENGESIFYNNSGIVNDGTNVGSDFQEWLTITNNGKILGSHAYDAPSMFFYENMQGDYENNPDKSKYNKQPQYDDVKDFLDELEKNPDAQPSSFDTKDNVPMGTYIEVEGYYLSQNKENIGSGPIKYRFMLGKNTTYNFNAQRNHHYKVTLKFHGWANQPEWHIDYVEENPGLYVPDRFYMPYLYNQKADFPVKLNGKCKSLKMEIVENAWGPRLPYDGSKQPAETVNATGDNPGAAAGMPLSYYNFVWNYEVWQKYNGRTWPSLGFLALTKPSDNPPANILMNYSFTDQLTGYNALKTY